MKRVTKPPVVTMTEEYRPGLWTIRVNHEIVDIIPETGYAYACFNRLRSALGVTPTIRYPQKGRAQ